jgi:hypothetical protein
VHIKVWSETWRHILADLGLDCLIFWCWWDWNVHSGGVLALLNFWVVLPGDKGDGTGSRPWPLAGFHLRVLPPDSIGMKPRILCSGRIWYWRFEPSFYDPRLSDGWNWFRFGPCRCPALAMFKFRGLLPDIWVGGTGWGSCSFARCTICVEPSGFATKDLFVEMGRESVDWIQPAQNYGWMLMFRVPQKTVVSWSAK